MNHEYLGAQAQRVPDKPAVIMAATGETVTYRELNERSNRFAQAMYSFGLRPGDHIAFCLENNARFHELCWAAQRSGLYYTAINSHLTAEEVGYIVNDCSARVLVISRNLGTLAEDVVALTPKVERRLVLGGTAEGSENYDEFISAYPPTSLEHEQEGAAMLYSSGTTGRPKGVKRDLPVEPIGTPSPVVALLQHMFKLDGNTVFLNPAPLYHSAPLGSTMSLLRLGATVVIMEKFDALETLRYIERYRITTAQFVPTMFIRMLKLPPEERLAFDVSSLKSVYHVAAPCPVEVKQQMIEWLGPIVYEYYGGTELNGLTYLTSQEALAHPGSVGKPVLGKVHILGEDSNELPAGETGVVWFSDGPPFEYYNDPQKTANTYNEKGWSTLWDVGYLDEEGFLYLTDRKSFMIVSGGVNIYPQEIENVLVMHPKVMDVAVFGVPNEDLGEEVKAVVQPHNMLDAGPTLEQELLEFCRSHLARYKCPRSIDFEAELPRSPTGKLYKRLLRDRYWGNRTSRIV